MATETHVPDSNARKPQRKLKNSILDNFSKITNPNEKVRVKSGLNLIGQLVETEEQDETELKYALGRIIRGLGSSTSHARTGFFAALVGLLSVNTEITCEEVFEQVEKHLHKTGSNSKRENADICSGQILACGAIIRSELYQKAEVEDQKKVIEILLSAGRERSYLILISYIIILDLLETVTDKHAQKNIFPLIESEFSKPLTEYTIDTLHFLLGIQTVKPKLITEQFLKTTLGINTVICDDTLTTLADIITTIPRITSLKHPIYKLLAEKLSKSELLQQFFLALDAHLTKPNRNKHLVFAELFANILDNLEDFSTIPDLLTENFVKQTINYFKSFTKNRKDMEFQKHMHEFFEKLLVTLKKPTVSTSIKIDVLKRLLFYPGTFIFEKITRSKIIQHITLTFDVEGVKELSDVYSDVVTGNLRIDIGPNTNETWLNNDRLYAAHMLVKLLRLPVVQKENDWKADKLGFLMNLSLVKKGGISNIGVELAASLKEAFYGALDLKPAKLEDIQTILLKLVRSFDEKINESNLETILRNPISEDEYKTWQKTLETISKIEKKRKKTQGVKSVFLTLFLYMSLQIFNDPKLALQTLKELFSCYERVRKNRKNSLNDTEVNETENSEDPLWIEVVVDLFLNLLSHNSHLLRSVIGNVFPHLCGYLNATAIHQILSVLDPKNDDNPLSQDSDDDDDDDDDDEDDESDPEGEEDSDESDEDEDEVDEGEDEDMGEEKSTDRLRIALHQALKSNNLDDDQESIDLDQLSDSEGQKLDEALAEAFKQFRPKKGKSKKQNKDSETLTHFRIRALDLIEIYLDSNPDMLLTLEIMLPLLQAVEFSIRDEHQQPLHMRLKAILKKLSTLKKFETTDGVTPVVLADLLKSLLEKGTKNTVIIQEMGEQIAECCIFVIKCSLGLITTETPKKVKKHLKQDLTQIITEELNNFFTKRDCLTPYVLFKNALNLSWEGSLDLCSNLLGFVHGDIKPFKKAQALELLKIFFANQRFLSQSPNKYKKKLKVDVETFIQQTIELFEGMCENPAENKVKEKFLCNLFHVLTGIKSSPLKFEFDWEKVGNVVREYRTFVSFSKDAKTAYNKLCSNLGVPHVVKMKSITKLLDPTKDDDEEEVTQKVKTDKKKKKKLNKDNLKLKKEAKMLRLQSLSEGLSNTVGFASQDFTDQSQDVEMKEVEEIEKKSKKRKSENVENGINGTSKKTKADTPKRAKKKKAV